MFYFYHFILGFCLCGCGYEIPIRNKKGLLSRFKNGHAARLVKGDKNHKWKNGFQKDHGYLAIYRPNHIHATTKGIIKLHRYLYEKYYNCCLLRYTEIHHINGNTLDNRKSNLQPLYKNQHLSISKSKDHSNTVCLLCGVETTYIRKNNNRPSWHKYKNGYICSKCSGKFYREKYKNNV